MSRPVWTGYGVKAGLLICCVCIYFFIPAVNEFVHNSFAVMKEHNLEALRHFILSYGIWAPLTAVTVVILQSLVPFMPGMILTIANAWLFGWFMGACYSWIGAFLGAALDFFLARWYGRPFVESFVAASQLELLNRFCRRYGLGAIFFARMMPLVPYKVVSYGAGVTQLTAREYLWATALGQTPPLLLYSYLGQNITRSFRLTLLITSFFVVLLAVLYYYRKEIERYFFQKYD
ncbi:MAG: TVP38/TMEM64 family protein [Sporomusaceae bacterium]|nr:TVP38/TMEM64 family protein [Sporomusaceae bacterium]